MTHAKSHRGAQAIAEPGLATAATIGERRDDAAFGAEIGRLIRRCRARRGTTRRQLATESGISERYLAQIESGAGNPSVIVMRAIADALEVQLTELLPQSAGRDAVYLRALDLLGRIPPGELVSVTEDLARRLDRGASADRGRRVALVGLRGAGKSTLGLMLAQVFGCPFIELNRMIEQEYGASIPLLIEMSGIATFRRYERACLERALDDHDRAVIATAGGIVSNPQTYALLLRRSRTVWVSARPDEHMSRVMQQGDFRPMAHNREAMTDLLAILEARRADYARAEIMLDTSGSSVEDSFHRLKAMVSPWLDGS